MIIKMSSNERTNKQTLRIEPGALAEKAAHVGYGARALINRHWSTRGLLGRGLKIYAAPSVLRHHFSISASVQLMVPNHVINNQ